MVADGLAAAGGAFLGAGGIGELGKGAVFGALIVGAAYLAGLAVLSRNVAATFALVMVLAAAALEFTALGLLGSPSQGLVIMLQAVFGASALVFLAATVRAARQNALLGGVMSVAALSLVGMGVLALIGRGAGAAAMNWALVAIGLFGLGLALSQIRRDAGARHVLPGVMILLAAAVAAMAGGGFVAHALFAFGVLTASLVAFADPPVRLAPLRQLETETQQAAPEPLDLGGEDNATSLVRNQLAQVLDYAGVAVWDWRPDGAESSGGLAGLLGADLHALTPQTLRARIHPDSLAIFDRDVIAHGSGDGGFDVSIALLDGRRVRLRGARAASLGKEIERLVAFVEEIDTLASRSPRPADAHLRELDGATETASADLAREFPDALRRGDITMVFQPIRALDSGEIAGYETLARWRSANADEAKATAEEVVEAAEQSGMGAALSSFALQAASDHLLARMRATGRRDLFVTLNLAFRQMRRPAFLAEVESIMRAKNLPAKSLVLELTESEAVTDADAEAAVFAPMRAAGVALAFDDFGAGFSSLRDLGRFSFDYLKIDKHFIRDLVQGGPGATVARGIAAIARELGMTVIAEGVETERMAEAARAIGCELGQGFALGEPGADRVRAQASPPDSEDGAEEVSRRRLWRAELR